MSERLSKPPNEMNEAAKHLLSSLGLALREARQTRGEDLYDVANFLRIKPSYLYGLEEGDLSMTPGRTYALGFIRSYAEYVGFDGNDVVRQVKQALDQTSPPPPLHYRTPIAESSRPSGFLVGLSIVLLGIIYGTWHIYFRDQPVIERVAAVPGELGRLASSLLDRGAGAPEKAATPTSSAAPASPGSTAPAPGRSSPVEPAAPNQTAPAPGQTILSGLADGRPLMVRPGVSPSVRGDIGSPSPALPERGAETINTQSQGGLGLPSDSTATSLANRTPGELTRSTIADHGEVAASVTSTPLLPAVVALGVAPPAAEPAAVPGPSELTTQDLLSALQAPSSADPASSPGSQATAAAPLADQTPAADPMAAAAADASRVTLLARDNSWIQIRSADRTYVRTTTMAAGQRIDLPNRTDLALWTGNAGGLEIMVDGQNMGALGASGRVVRDVPLAPDSLKARQTTPR